MDWIEIIRDNRGLDAKSICDSKLDTDFTLITSNGRLDVNRKALQAYSPIISNIPNSMKKIEVFGADVKDLRSIVDYCVHGKCLVPKSRLHLVCDLSERLEFHDFLKKIQNIISGQKESSVASTSVDTQESSDEDQSPKPARMARKVTAHGKYKATAQSDIDNGCRKRRSNRNDKITKSARTQSSLEINAAHGSRLDKVADNKVESDESDEDAVFNSESHSNKCIESSNENQCPKPARMIMEVTAKWKYKSYAHLAIDSDWTNEWKIANSEPQSKMTESENVLHISPGHNDRVKTTFDNNVESDESDEESDESDKESDESDEESDESDEDSLLNRESRKKGFKWSENFSQIFLSVWLQSITDPKIDMGEELAKHGPLLSSQYLRYRKSCFREKYMMHIKGTKQPDIKPYLSLIKEILDVEKSGGPEKRGCGPIWTKEMVDVLLNVWVKYARRRQSSGNWDNISSEIVDELAQKNFKVTHSQVMTKKYGLLEMYKKRKKRIQPYVRLLDEIHSLVKK